MKTHDGLEMCISISYAIHVILRYGHTCALNPDNHIRMQTYRKGVRTHRCRERAFCSVVPVLAGPQLLRLS